MIKDTVNFDHTTDGRRISFGAVLSAIPDFGLAALFLITWITPDAFDEKMVSYLVLVMLMEFIIVHSSGFMGHVMMSDGDKKKRGFTLAGLGLFYTLFVGAFAFAFGEWWPLAARFLHFDGILHSLSQLLPAEKPNRRLS